MRLKGTFKDAVSFMKIIQAIARMSSQCILRFGEDEINIVVPKGIDAVETWASLSDLVSNEEGSKYCRSGGLTNNLVLIAEQHSFFISYRVESNHNNQVNLEVSTEAFLQVLKSACVTNAETVIKLAKRDGSPVLCLEIRMNMGTSHESYVVHQIPIRIKKPKDMESIKTAEESTKDLQANAISLFPPITEVRSVAERMKTLDPNKVVIAVNRNGELKLIMSSDTIKIETIWKDLKYSESPEEVDIRPEALARFKNVRVDLKSFVKLMSCQLPEHDIELWLYQRICATFVFHIKSPVQSKDVDFAAHIMVHLPSLTSD